jgi:hypothetical protein
MIKTSMMIGLRIAAAFFVAIRKHKMEEEEAESELPLLRNKNSIIAKNK